jgi:DNA polymerase-3 subunit gamma/tau
MNKNYVPLYRKYRPQTLETLVGQEHVKKTLTSAIELGKISHAYLFTGPRGTGKTSTARILAKSLNCINGPTVNPCGECASCKDISNSVPIDVIEIDAASNRKVEDTQNILEKVQYVPVNGKFKIYIIDEVHMLTNHAFNALLKTLEEPPENVIFILATTEVHKVLDTIKSRCQRYDFRRITTDDIVKHLRYISDNENIKITNDALLAIAKNSAGGMRDSISLLDQLSILGISKEVDVEDVNSILGRISFDALLKLSNQIISSSTSKAIEFLNDIYNSGNEPLQILTNLSEYFKNLLIVKTCSNDLLLELTGLNEPQINELKQQKELLEAQQIVFLIERISYYIKEIKLATNQHLWLEVGMIDLTNMTENSTLLDLQNRVRALEENGTSFSAIPQVVTKQAPVAPPLPTTTNTVSVQNNSSHNVVPNQILEKTIEDDFTPPPISKKPSGNDINSLWQLLLSNIKSSPTVAMLKQLATPLQISPEGIVLTVKNERLVSQINDTNKKQMIIDAANVMFNQDSTSVVVRLAQSGDVQIQPTSKPIMQADSNPRQVQQQVKTGSVKQANEEQLEVVIKKELSNENIERLESDQEKMVLELFDGKYVE